MDFPVQDAYVKLQNKTQPELDMNDIQAKAARWALKIA